MNTEQIIVSAKYPTFGTASLEFTWGGEASGMQMDREVDCSSWMPVTSTLCSRFRSQVNHIGERV